MGITKDKKLLTATTQLRRLAEDRLRAKTAQLHPSRTEEAAQRLVHELEVHQIELEMQNAELKRAQEELELSRNKYVELYDFAPVGYFTFDTRGLIREVNLAGAQLLGTRGQLLANKPFISFIADADERKIFSKHLESVLQRQGMQRCEIILKRQDGTVIYSQLQSVMGGTIESKDCYILSSIVDGTVGKLAEDALLKAGALQRAIFNSANFSSIATDAKGVIQIFNVGAERMLGYTAAEVMNKITPADISDPQEIIVRAAALSLELGTKITPGFEALVFKASRGIEDIYELTYIRKDGSRFPAVVSVTALRDAQEAIIGYLLIGTDNTVRKVVEAERERLDQALQDQNAELEQAKLVAEKANLAKSDFLSSMSHELRSPLNAILGFAQLMESDSPPPTPSQTASIEQILQGGWYLLKLINEILDLSAIESGRMSMSTEPVSLIEVMLECQTMIEPQAQKRNIRLTFAPFDNSWFVHADRTRVKQVIINLLSNAIKYNGERGTVVVDCTAKPPGRIHISITDTGAGLSPENLAQLFQPFNRLGQENSTEEGTGIGLVLSKRLVELMEGEIGVESTVGAGSVFWIELMSINAPQFAIEGDESMVVAKAQVTGGAKRRTLLYVEDNPANMELVEQIIGRYPNLQLLTAVNGNSGIEIARVSLPEVILMDLNLPDISGAEALKTLLGDPVTTHIPVIAISANAMSRDIEKGLASGFFRYLTKPIKVNELVDALNVALKYVDKENEAKENL
jgi:PAS domain S-box-containing protein